MSLTVALEALRDDAQAWDETSQVLSRAAGSARLLALSQAEMSFASEAALANTYELIRAKIEGLLTDGASQTVSIADTLLAVRAAYQSTDQAGADKLRGTWDLR